MPKTVLIVDDSRTARRGLAKCLPPGWAEQVLEATNGQEALDTCERTPIDVMFLDLTMPEVDGFTVLERLKYSPHRPPTIIVVSADVQPKARLRVVTLGAFDFVDKPATEAAIRNVIALAGLQ